MRAERRLVIRGARCAMGPRDHFACVDPDRRRSHNPYLQPPARSCPTRRWARRHRSKRVPDSSWVCQCARSSPVRSFPEDGNPPYRNYIDWGEDIHSRFPEVIAKHHAVPKEVRLWWGGIRNLLCGVTTVCHHDPLWPELQREDFPVRVVREYGWGHSLALGGDLRQARAATPVGRPFIVHACEGVDEQAREELWELDRLGLLDGSTVLVHGLALDREGVALMRERRASLIVCPSSNKFLFGKTPRRFPC